MQDDEYTKAELAEMLEEAKPTSMVKLSPTNDWIVTAWCSNCDAYHHYWIVEGDKPKLKKPLIGFELIPPLTKDGKMKAQGDGGLRRLEKKFESVDHAGEEIEEMLFDEEEEEDD